MGEVRHSRQDVSVEARIDAAERILGRTFRDRALLRQALTHPSAVEARDPKQYYERLEFLGDSIIGFLVAEEVFRRFPDMHEGGMTRIRVSVIAGSVLAGVAEDLGLAECLILGESELGTGRRGRASALENSFEAVTAALYLDAGLPSARKWVLRTLGPLISEDVAAIADSPKSRLQEELQARGHTPVYRIVGHEGPPHDRHFTAVVLVGDEVAGEGSGRSKKEAEAQAALIALDRLPGREDAR